MRLTPLLCFLVLLLALSSSAPAQQRIQLGKDDLAPGLFLVAPREPADETFAHTVILLIRHDDTGTLGLVINQPTEIPLARVFAHLKSARHLSEVAYSGGPVQNDAVLALSRSRAKERDAQTILNDLYLVATEKQLERILRATPSTKNLRVYLGYTGWAPGQLNTKWISMSGEFCRETMTASSMRTPRKFGRG